MAGTRMPFRVLWCTFLGNCMFLTHYSQHFHYRFRTFATDAGHATKGTVEEDLTDDDSTKDPSFMTDRTSTVVILTHQKTSCQRLTQISQILMSVSCLKTPNLRPKRPKKWRKAEISTVFRLLTITFTPST